MLCSSIRSRRLPCVPGNLVPFRRVRVYVGDELGHAKMGNFVEFHRSRLRGCSSAAFSICEAATRQSSSKSSGAGTASQISFHHKPRECPKFLSRFSEVRNRIERHLKLSDGFFATLVQPEQ